MNFPTTLNQLTISRLLFPQQQEFSTENTTSIHINSGSFQVKYSFVQKESPTILLFPATNGNLQQLDEFIEGLAKQQLNALLLSSPSWSEEAEQPISLQSYVEDGPALFDAAQALLNEHQIHGPLFIAGHGLGTLPAIETIQKRKENLKGIFLEGAICDLQKLLSISSGETDYPAIESEAFSLQIEQAIAQISAPTLIFHGAADNISSIAQAERLQSFSGAKKKQFFVIPGAKNPGEAPLCHWAGELYFQTIRTFIDTVCGTNTWRQRRRRSKTTQ